jgi:hypothetical protein
MKVLAYITVLLVLWVLLLEYPYAQEQIKEMSMKTETGEIVLTSQECIFKKMGLQGYDYAAYATELGHANHEGCWKSDSYEGKHAVYIYFPEINQTAVFDAKLFQPKASV